MSVLEMRLLFATSKQIHRWRPKNFKIGRNFFGADQNLVLVVADGAGE